MAIIGTITGQTELRQDLTTVALRQAVGDNHVAYNLPNSFVDQFESDAGLSTQTTVDRHTNETVSPNGPVAEFNYVTANSGSGITVTEVGSWNMASTMTVGGSGNLVPIFTSSIANHWAFSAGTVDVGFSVDYLTAYNWKQMVIGKNCTWGDITQIHLSHSDNGSSWTDFDLTGSAQTATYHTEGGSDSCDMSTFSSGGIIDWSGFSSISAPNDVHNTFTIGTPVSKRYLKLIFKVIQSRSGSNYNAGASAFRVFSQDFVGGATGTLISTANVPSSAVTKVSGVLLYEDVTGTATIGTDIKVYFTCDNSNWTETTYTAVTPVFTGTIKMLRLGQTTCTSGSDVRYKVVWANQTAKDSPIHGIGLNY